MASAQGTPHSSRLTHAVPSTGTVLAFDFGEKRIGVATGDLALGIAHPLTVIAAEDGDTRFAVIAALIAEWHPVRLVVGVPHHADGGEHKVGRLAQRFARRLEGRFGIAVECIDETLTSAMAESRLRESGVHGKKVKAALDAAAAREILEAWFEQNRVKRKA